MQPGAWLACRVHTGHVTGGAFQLAKAPVVFWLHWSPTMAVSDSWAAYPEPDFNQSLLKGLEGETIPSWRRSAHGSLAMGVRSELVASRN